MINYKFYYFGPHLFHTKLSPLFCNELFKRGGNKLVNCSENLAGHFNTEYYFTDDDITFFKDSLSVDVIPTFLNSANNFYNTSAISNFKDIKLEQMWINFMKKGDFNPVHTHSHDLSFVLYLKVPKELKEENEKYHGTDETAGPGGIAFMWGEPQDGFIHTKSLLPEEGDLFIFPALLRHMVYPFKSNVERVSVAGNMKLI